MTVRRAAWNHPSCPAFAHGEWPHPTHPRCSARSISVTFIEKSGKESTIQVPLGKSMLEAAHENEIDLEGGEGILPTFSLPIFFS